MKYEMSQPELILFLKAEKQLFFVSSSYLFTLRLPMFVTNEGYGAYLFANKC